MDHRLFIPLLIATLIAFPARSHADDTRWESLRVYALADGQSVAVAVPAEWREAGKAQVLRAGCLSGSASCARAPPRCRRDLLDV